MFPLFWLLRNLGGLARWGGGPGRRPGKSGGGRAWEGGEGERSEPSRPHSSRQNQKFQQNGGGRDTERDTHTERQRATHSQKEEGAHTLGDAAPPPGQEVGRSQSSKLVPAAFSAPASLLGPLCVQRPPHSRLTWSFSLQSSKRGFWTDARPQARILRWWKAGGTA